MKTIKDLRKPIMYAGGKSFIINTICKEDIKENPNLKKYQKHFDWLTADDNLNG